MTEAAEEHWTPEELERIGDAEELRIAPLGPDGELRDPVTIWVVRHGEDLFVRPYRGPSRGWYRARQARHEGRVQAGGIEKVVIFADVAHEMDAAYREKYGRFEGLVDQMVSPETQATTIRLTPRGDVG